MIKILIEVLVQVFHDNVFFFIFFPFFIFLFFRLDFWTMLYLFNGHIVSFDERKKFVCACLCFEGEGVFLT